jgi:PAS domain S-box-containing protein
VSGHEQASRPKLLVADDEEGLLFLMVEALRREGFDAEGVESGSQALKWLERQRADLLLLDLKLLDLPAPVLMQRLRERGQEFPFIIVTGHGDERTAVEMMKQGALDYVMKEAGMLDFLPSTVRRAIGVIQRERQLAEANATAREREERLQKIIQSALDGFARFDAGWRIIEKNDALCGMLGYTRQQLRGMSLAELEVGITEEQLAARATRLRADGFAQWFTRLKKSDGAHLEVEISMRAGAGEYFGFIHDLSEQRRLERQVLQISEDERRRFGHELHDGLGQQLTAIELMSHTLARELKAKKVGLSKSAYEIAEFTRKTIAQARQLAHGLAPVALDADGLITALNELARGTTSAGVECDFRSESPPRIGDVTVATHLFRIAQEAVNNALRHARASRIGVRLEQTSQWLELTIEDNGRGMATACGRNGGMGLDVMRHRARLIGGQLSVESRRGKGTRIVCSIAKQP